MGREFNTAGPCRADLHYMLPATRRVAGLIPLIEHQHYFVLHGPRQVGKTTALFGLAEAMNARPGTVAAVLSCEVGRAFPDDPRAACGHILEHWGRAAAAQVAAIDAPPAPPPGGWTSLASFLEAWARASFARGRALVVFLDEVDALEGKTMLTVLAELRAGFPLRPHAFPASIALVGMRDVQDYKVASGSSAHLGTSSPFNVKVESVRLRGFTRAEVEELYGQHTADTGQHFLEASVDRAYELTRGQPWLVNALGREVVMVLAPDRSRPIDAALIDAAKDRLIAQRATHLDSLAERLREPRVRAILGPLIAGDYLPANVPEDDYDYLLDLGLLERLTTGELQIANPIYREVIPRALAHNLERTLPALSPAWLGPDGKLDAPLLLADFLDFWRQHGEPLLRGTAYPEIAPHLVLMAFLHRVVNGRGRITREYAAGTGRMDLLVEHGDRRLAIEVKVWRDRAADPCPDGLAQLDGYLERVGAQDAWLVVFDERSIAAPLPQRLRAEVDMTPRGRKVVVVRA